MTYDVLITREYCFKSPENRNKCSNLQKTYKYRTMILNIVIENYRSFKNKTVFTMIAESSKSKEQNTFIQPILNEDPVRLLNTAIIYGPNGSGKTNFLRSVFDIVNFISTNNKVGEEIKRYSPFILNNSDFKEPLKFKIEFIGKDNVRYSYELAFNNQDILEESLYYFPLGKSRLLFERIPNSNLGPQIHTVKLGSDVKKKDIDVFNNQTILFKFGTDIPDPIISEAYVYLSKIEVINACNTRKVSSLKNEVAEMIISNSVLKKKMDELIYHADTGINTISVKETDERKIAFPENTPENIKMMVLNDYKYQVSGQHNVYNVDNQIIDKINLPIEQESHGTRTLFSLGGKILQSLETGTPIFIDEIDTGLHTYLAKMLMSLYQNKRINSKNAQLVFTTHDTNLLDRTFFRKDQVWFVEKNEYGVSELYSLQDFSDVREDTPFDKWYLSGKLGAIPNLKSLESLFMDE